MEDISKLGIAIGLTTGLLTAAGIGFYFYLKKIQPGENHPITLVDASKFPLKLISVEDLSHNTKRFRFALPSKQHILGLPIGNHVNIIAKIDGNVVVRPYTPITKNTTLGYVDFVIKIYKPDGSHPQGGKMSQFLSKLKPNEAAVDFRGPVGKIVYNGDGNFTFKANPPVDKHYDALSLVCGGTGITPMFQLISHILADKGDTTTISLIYANSTPDDVLLQKELLKLQELHPSKFSLTLTVSKPTGNWNYKTGRVTEKMFKESLFPAESSTGGFICGPSGFVKEACVPLFEGLGYESSNIHIY